MQVLSRARYLVEYTQFTRKRPEIEAVWAA